MGTAQMGTNRGLGAKESAKKEQGNQGEVARKQGGREEATRQQ